MRINITRANPLNALDISRIGKKSFRDAFQHLFKSPEELFQYLQTTYNPLKLEKSIARENNVYLIAWDNDRPVGFAKIKKHSLNDQIESIAQMELQKLYVTPECQGMGIGSALLSETIRLASEVGPDYLWLSTYISNENAIRLYEKNGFFKLGRFFFTIGSQVFEYHVMGLAMQSSDTSVGHLRGVGFV